MTAGVDMLRGYLRQTLDGSISRVEMARFVQLSRTIVASYLAAFRTSSAILCENLGISLTDLAYDCVADMFARNEKAVFIHLEGFVKSLFQPIDETPDTELMAAFRSALARFADMQLGRLYAQADPGGARIHRNIKECVKKEGSFRLTKDFRGWVLTPSGSPDLDHLPACSMEMISSEFHARLGGPQRIPGLLENLHQVLVSFTEYRRSIPLVAVVQLFKGVYREEQKSRLDEQEDRAFEGLTEFEITQLRGKVEQVLREKILVTYVAHGKVDRSQGGAMFFACCDLLGDWCSGDGANFGLFDYLKRYLPIDEPMYRAEFRVKMEYLMKIARDEFASRLMGDL